MNQYNKSRLLSIHSAFRDSPTYIFFREDVLIKKLLFSFQNRVLLSQHERQVNVLRKDLLGENGKKYGTVMPASIPGTDTYFAQKFLELCVFLSELGKPDLFITISANDYDSDLLKFLDGRKPEDSPVFCDMFFYERLQELLLLMKQVFGVADYWYRIEYQNRGSPHVHMLAWTNPKVTIDSVDSLIFASIPQGTDPTSKKIAEMVRRYQVHRCTQKCRSEGNRCKYGFPFMLQSSTTLSPNEKYVLYQRPNSGDEWIVPYNPSLLLAAASNINVQMPTDSGARFYIAKYAAKAEPSQNVILNPIEKHFHLRRVSVNNATDILLGKHCTHGTREVIYLNIEPREKMRRLLKKKSQLMIDEEQGVPEEEIFQDNFRDKYIDRPVELEAITIQEYLQKYEVFSPGSKIPAKRFFPFPFPFPFPFTNGAERGNETEQVIRRESISLKKKKNPCFL